MVPNLAKREHLKNLPVLFGRLRAKYPRLKFDLITVTVGPGLEPALWTGITFAQSLAKEYRVPIVGANHLEGHLYSFLLSQKKTGGGAKGSGTQKNIFPAIALIVSGGHTILLKLESFSKWKRLGETRDDAAGEAFDKVARLLDLPYPGGPEVERLARTGNPHAIAFPRPMSQEKNYDFSFSGLKTSVLYYMRDHEGVSAKRSRCRRVVPGSRARCARQKNDPRRAGIRRAIGDALRRRRGEQGAPRRASRAKQKRSAARSSCRTSNIIWTTAR